MIILLIYVAIFVISFLVVKMITSRLTQAHDFASLKTVTFGDESAVTADRTALRPSEPRSIAVWALWPAPPTWGVAFNRPSSP